MSGIRSATLATNASTSGYESQSASQASTPVSLIRDGSATIVASTRASPLPVAHNAWASSWSIPMRLANGRMSPHLTPNSGSDMPCR